MADNVSRTIKAALRRIAAGNKRFAPFFQWAIEQPEGTRETPLDDIEHAVGLSRLQAVSLCKQLQDATVGRFIAGRRGRPSRLEWNVDPRAVGAVIAQSEETLEEDGEDEAASPRRARALPQQRSHPEPVVVVQTAEREDEDRYAYRIRHDRQVHFALPVDLTQREAARLAEFVRALGLPDEPDGAAFGLD